MVVQDALRRHMSLFSRATQSWLPDSDYLPVAMPTTDVYVLQVLAGDGQALRRYSRLDNVLVHSPDSGLPAIKPEAPVVDASGSVTRSTKIGLGLSVLSEILHALGAGAGVDLKVEAATGVEYGYANVNADSVDLADLDRWLVGADFDPRARTTSELLAAEEMYVVVATLKASAVTVQLLDANQKSIELDVPAVQGLVGGQLTVSASTSRSSRLTFHGSTALVVAAKAVRIQLDERGFYLDRRPRQDGEVRGGLAGRGVQPQLLEGGSLRLSNA